MQLFRLWQDLDIAESNLLEEMGNLESDAIFILVVGICFWSRLKMETFQTQEYDTGNQT